MKILFTCDSMNSGGAEKVISTLANEFSAANIEVYILMVSSGIKKSFYTLSSKVSLISIFDGLNKKVKKIKRIKLLRTKIKEIQPDIIISFLSHVIIYTFFATIGTKYKLIVSERNDPNNYSFIIRKLNKFCFRHADGCIYQTNQAMDWYGTSKDNSEIILNPVNLTYMQSQDITVRKHRIITVGRLVEQKNHFLLIEAFALFKKEYKDYELMIYGEGPLKEKLKMKVSELGLEKSVNFLGNSSTWHKDEIDASLFVLTSNYEGMPNSLLEALCLNIPCVSTDCPIGGPRELLTHFKSLLLVPCNNPDLLQQGMKQQLINKKKNIICSEDFNATNISKKWLKFIFQILKR